MTSRAVLKCINAKRVGETASGLDLYYCPVYDLRVTRLSLGCRECDWKNKPYKAVRCVICKKLLAEGDICPEHNVLRCPDCGRLYRKGIEHKCPKEVQPSPA